VLSSAGPGGARGLARAKLGPNAGRPTTMADEERQQRRRDAALKRAQTIGKEGRCQASLKAAAKRTPEERSQAARQAAETRWRNREAKKSAGEASGP
jgi:hypothetical protein